MFSKNLQKKISKLYLKKYRLEMGLFVAEGEKVVNELLNSNYEYDSIYSTKFINDNYILLKNQEMKKISFLKTPSSMLGIFKIPKINPEIDYENTIIAIDSINDPGNLGTIIRLCDWFGIKNIICSKDSVECFNPKVIQATMGSIARVNCLYLDLCAFLMKTKKKVYGTFLNGKSIYRCNLEKKAIYVFGNESNGISNSLQKILNPSDCKQASLKFIISFISINTDLKLCSDDSVTIFFHLLNLFSEIILYLHFSEITGTIFLTPSSVHF